MAIKTDGTQYGYCVFKAGSTELVVEAVGDDAPEEDKVLVGRFTGLSFTVQDAEAKYHELTARGVLFTGPPERQLWGGILATLQDPAGNELHQPSASASPMKTVHASLSFGVRQSKWCGLTGRSTGHFAAVRVWASKA